MEKCRHSGKNCYSSEANALIGAVKSAGKRNTSQLRVYKCNWCYQWHLTSRKR